MNLIPYLVSTILLVALSSLPFAKAGEFVLVVKAGSKLDLCTFTSCLLFTPSDPMQVMILGRLMPPASENLGSNPSMVTMFS